MTTTIEKHADTDNTYKKLFELIKDIRIAMLTTADAEGNLHSRPMGTQQSEFDGELWFFTSADSGKVFEVQKDQHVNVSYANPNANTYVSVTGTARLVRDQDKAKELWQPFMKAWFPDGLDDPKLALLKVTVSKAEYWDNPASSIVKLVGFLKAVTTGKPEDLGENKEILLK